MPMRITDALTIMESSIKDKTVRLAKCRYDPNLRFTMDQPDGKYPRYSYVYFSESGGWFNKKIQVQAISILSGQGTHNGAPLFQLHFAVAPNFRGNGFA